MQDNFKIKVIFQIKDKVKIILHKNFQKLQDSIYKETSCENIIILYSTQEFLADKRQRGA